MVPLPPLRDGGCALPTCPFGRACLPLISDAPDCTCSPGRLWFFGGRARENSSAEAWEFQSARPMRGGRRLRAFILTRRREFQPARPVWGATPRWPARPGCARISIHAPRVGRDVSFFSLSLMPLIFQSTRPVWGATACFQRGLRGNQISIHAPRVGRDHRSRSLARPTRNFNPRAPCGARQQSHSNRKEYQYFNPRAPCGARPVLRRAEHMAWIISIHAPRVGRDGFIQASLDH